MDPVTIGAMALGGLTSMIQAGAQKRQGQRQANLELWQATEEIKGSQAERDAIYEETAFTRDAGFREAGSIRDATYREAASTARAGYDEAASIGRSSYGEAESVARAGFGEAGITRRAGYEEADVTRGALFREAGSVGQSALDQAVRSSRLYGLTIDIAKSNARIASQKGNLAENRTREATERAIGAQRSFFAGGNVDPNSGSALFLAASGAAQGEADVAIIRSRTAQEVAEQEMTAYGAAEASDYGTRAAGETVEGGYASAFQRADDATRKAALIDEGATERAGIAGSSAYDRARITATSATERAQIGARTGGERADIVAGSATDRAILAGDAATRRGIASADAVTRRAVGAGQAGMIAAINARKAGIYGAATTLLNQAGSWASNSSYRTEIASIGRSIYSGLGG